MLIRDILLSVLSIKKHTLENYYLDFFLNIMYIKIILI